MKEVDEKCGHTFNDNISTKHLWFFKKNSKM